jgi:hypothetical protein
VKRSGERRSVSSRTAETVPKTRRKPRDRLIGDRSGSGKAAGEDGQEEKGNQMSKDEGGWNSSLSEKPVRSRLRRLVDWINLAGAKKVHSLIDKVYKRKNLCRSSPTNRKCLAHTEAKKGARVCMRSSAAEFKIPSGSK